MPGHGQTPCKVTGMHANQAKKKLKAGEMVMGTYVRYGDPALYKKLLTPMVHAKSQHLLKEIFSNSVLSE